MILRRRMARGVGVSQSKYAYWPVEEKTRKVDWELT